LSDDEHKGKEDCILAARRRSD